MDGRFHIRYGRLLSLFVPLLSYLVVYYISDAIFLMALGDAIGKLGCLLLATILTTPVIYDLYRRLPIVRMRPFFEKDKLLKESAGIVLVAVLGVCLNLIVIHLPLYHISPSYETTNETLYGGPLFLIILTDCLAIPFLEETLFRGIILGQLSLWLKKDVIAVLLAAFVFGLFHFNVVQFLYGCIMGMALGALYVRTRKLWVVVAAHGLCNLAVILLF